MMGSIRMGCDGWLANDCKTWQDYNGIRIPDQHGPTWANQRLTSSVWKLQSGYQKTQQARQDVLRGTGCQSSYHITTWPIGRAMVRLCCTCQGSDSTAHQVEDLDALIDWCNVIYLELYVKAHPNHSAAYLLAQYASAPELHHMRENRTLAHKHIYIYAYI